MATDLAARIRRVRSLRAERPEDFTTAMAAADSYIRRSERLEHPAGHFDRAGRFSLNEPTNRQVRPASRSWPYSEMLHGRTLGHCAHLHGSAEADARVVVALLEALIEIERWAPGQPAAPAIASALAGEVTIRIDRRYADVPDLTDTLAALPKPGRRRRPGAVGGEG